MWSAVMSSFACARAALLVLIATSNVSAREVVSDGSPAVHPQALPAVAAADCGAAQGPTPCVATPGWRGNYVPIRTADVDWGMPAATPVGMLAGLPPQSHAEQALQLPAATGGYTLSWSDGSCERCAGKGRAGTGPQHYRISFNGAVLAERTVSPGAGRQEHHLAFRARGPGIMRFERKGGSGAGTVLIDGVAVRENMSLPAGGSALLVSLGVLTLGGRRRIEEKFIA
jgi:hypothetical protein